jgi:predicted nucleic acid-binding Zn ribbon protein
MATPKRHAAMKKPPRASRIREEILREWRGAEEPADLSAGIHLAQKFVAAILRAAGAEDGLHEDQVRATWKELAGDFIARHTEPISVKDGNLVLRVTQPALRFQLEQMKPMLLTRIRTQLGEGRIKSIKFQLG